MKVYELMKDVSWDKSVAVFFQSKDEMLLYSFGLAWEMQFEWDIENWYQDTDGTLVVIVNGVA